MKERNSTQRKDWIDICKGALILGVILGHAFSNQLLSNFLSSFYMPCFFVLSGFLMKKEGKLKEFMRKKVKSILLPYVFFAVLWVLFLFVKSFVIESDFKLLRALLSIVLPYSGSPHGTHIIYGFCPACFYHK